eukprot:TRINITY_DN2861_c0_g1_i4.p1 TRINITY_DN2861_c0_g1~~TRINITY_DN2861_c0_g1_i4.p1  ORF type:complete len:517 (+),score=46.70 TRINITY_DN2861_c0_g1_i4:40-1590(+)
MQKLRKKIRVFALYTRLFIFILQFVCNLLIPDHESGTFTWIQDPDHKPTVLDKILSFLLDGLIRWDGQHFLHVANHGYTFETNTAFFPLYPLIVRIFANLIYWMQEEYAIITFYSAIKVSAIFINLGCFLLATDAFYDLSRRVLKDEYLAYKAGLLFAINPASVFFSAAYSESLNAYLTFALLNRITKSLSAKTCILTCLASATRSNSILNAGFILYSSLKTVATETILYIRLKKNCKEKAELSTTIANILGDAIIPGLFNIISSIVPFFLFQWFCFTNFCRITKYTPVVPDFLVNYGRSNLLKILGDDPSEWCSHDPPIAYFYIQKNYWNNGFLSYWEVKQLPNFGLAMPVLATVLISTYNFIGFHWDYVKRLGLVDNNLLGMPRRPILAVRQYRTLPRECFVYMVHAAALAIFATLFMNVQVATRLILSASPVVPWLAAILTTHADKPPVPLSDDDNNKEVLHKVECKSNLESSTDTILFQEKLDTEAGRWIMMYFLGYFLIGTILFSNNLPWT